MNEIKIIYKVINSWNLPLNITQGWQKLAEILDNTHGLAGLVLWAHSALTWMSVSESERLVVAAHLCAIFLAQHQGHTLLNLDYPELYELLRSIQHAAGDDFYAPEKASAVFHNCVQGPLTTLFAQDANQAPFVYKDKKLQLSRTHWIEDACIRLLQERMDVPARPTGKDVLHGYHGNLDDQQRDMIRNAIQYRIFWVSGGPGTGKTTCIHGMLYAFNQMGVPAPRVTVVAPTGKAAFRITSSLRRMALPGGGPFDEAILNGHFEALTLHRLLEYHPQTQRFGRHEGNPLELDCVIVDESSMVDLVMLHALLRAVPLESSLVFVGDQHQLPPVGQGAPFQTAWEFASCRPNFFFRLERNYRAQLELYQDLHLLLHDAKKMQWHTYKIQSKTNGISLHSIQTDAEFFAFLNQIFQETYDESYWELALQRHLLPDMVMSVQDSENKLVQLVERAQACPVLCAVHTDARGTQRVNEWMRRRHPWGGLDLQPGEPIMVQVNDYARNLFNGDCGVVADIECDGRPLRCAVFKMGNQLRAFELINLQVERAYAFSVHKSQGSEYNRITFVLPDTNVGILTRELVYTAVTRARHTVRVAGNPTTLLLALNTVVRRHSQLAQAWQKDTR